MKQCTQCNEQNLDHASFCSKCGAPLPINSPENNNESAQNHLHHAVPRPPQFPMPSTYLWQSIVVTLLCCMPLGIPAIVFASQVETRYLLGNYEASYRASQKAKIFCIWAFVIGLLVPIISFFISMMIGIGLVDLLDELRYL